MSIRPHILFFIKAPVRGRVKSRLAASLGDDVALRLYENFLRDGLETIIGSGYPFNICVDPPDAVEAAADWLGGAYRFSPQQGADLGERMGNAFSRCFANGVERAILVGSDLPDLPAAIFQEAESSLQEYDVVLGPAHDGGYYLIGFNRSSFLPPVFQELPWGTDTVCRRTLDKLYASALSVHLTPEWNDIDTMDDLNAFCSRNRNRTLDKSRTLGYCKTIGIF